MWRCGQERSVKPSAQPTLVRTQHLPPPAKTAPGLRKRGPAGRFLLVTPCIRVRHYGSTHGSVHVHMVYSVRAKLAVRITARFAGPRPFCPVTGLPTAAHSGRPVLSCPLAPGGGLALFVPEAGAGWPDRARAISSRLHGGDDRVCVAGCRRHGRPAGRRGERRYARIWTPWRAAASCSQGFPMFPVRDWIQWSRSCTCSGLVLDLSCTCRIPAPVTSLITSQRRPLVASAREVPGRLIRGVP